jgi:hypothetical protein
MFVTFLHRGPQWEILKVERTFEKTSVRARHLKTGKVIELMRDPFYAPRVDELKRCLEMELENFLDPTFAEYRRQRILDLPGKKI